jgi:hypothetical protein
VKCDFRKAAVDFKCFLDGSMDSIGNQKLIAGAPREVSHNSIEIAYSHSALAADFSDRQSRFGVPRFKRMTDVLNSRIVRCKSPESFEG